MSSTSETNQKSKIAIVTGGSRGIGRSIVLNLARRGVDTIFTYHSNQEQANEVVRLVAEYGAQGIPVQLDTSNVANFDAFVQTVNQKLTEMGTDRFDYLVNNAGVGFHKSFEQTLEEEMDLMYSIHFKGVFFLTQKLLPLLQDGGRIVNISSGLARFSLPGSSAYASMKGAVEVLTRYLAKELGPRGIAVNTVAPGAIATDFSGGMVRDNAGVNQLVSSMTALGRPGEPDEIGSMIASLLSEDNRWINGQRIEVSGGMVL